MRVDCLADADQAFAILVNCRISDDAITCGFAWFLGGISGDIELVTPDRRLSLSIRIPDEVQNVVTEYVLCDPKDQISIRLGT